MEDNFDTDIVDNSETNEVENEVSENVENEISENVETKEEKKEEFKPWKNKTPESIPYNRFSEKVREANEYKERLAQYEKELAEFKNVKDKVSKIESVDDLNIDDFTDMKEYQKALVQVAQKEFERDMQRRDHERQIREAEDRIITTFGQSVERAAKLNPEIKEAIEYAGQFTQYIPAETRYALLTDEYGPEVINEIVTTPGMLESIIKMNPIDAGRKIGRMSAKYEKMESEHKAPQIPSHMEKPAPKVAKTPNVQGKTNASFGSYSDDISMSEYRKLKAKGKV